MANSKGSDQIVAVLDTQVDALHPQLLGRTTTGKPSLLGILGLGDLNLVGKSLLGPLLTDGPAKNHGTFVSAIVLRAAPQAKVLPIAVLNANGRGSTAQVAAGIRIAADRGADVINMSLHTTADTRVLREAVQYALARNVVLVAAFGNEGQQNPGNIYPASYPGVIAVMSVDGRDQRASFSNYGRANLVAAPGVDVISAYETLSLLYGIGSGTSFSAPWVSGAAAAVRGHHGVVSSARVQAHLVATGDDVDAQNGGRNAGRLNVQRALATRVK